MSQSITKTHIVLKPKANSKSTTVTKSKVTSIKSQFVPDSETVSKSQDVTKSQMVRKLSPDKKTPTLANTATKPKVSSIKSQLVTESESAPKSQDNTKSHVVRKLSPAKKTPTVANAATKPKVIAPMPSRYKPKVFAKSQITEVLASQPLDVPKPYTANKPQTANKPHTMDDYNAQRDIKKIDDKVVMNMMSEYMAESITMAAKSRGVNKSPVASKKSPAMLAEKKKTKGGTFDDILKEGVL